MTIKIFAGMLADYSDQNGIYEIAMNLLLSCQETKHNKNVIECSQLGVVSLGGLRQLK